MGKGFFAAFVLLCLAAGQAGAFDLVKGGRPAPVCYGGGEQVVRTALDMYAGDMAAVCGTAPAVAAKPVPGTIFAGVLGEKDTERFIRKYGIDAAPVKGKWDAFMILPAGGMLAVVGSNARGVAYGLLELSRRAGVSPWEWWADVTPEKRADITLPDGFRTVQAPSVQYRGIFLNDEDWGLVPWSARYEGGVKSGRIGPKTYSRIFELLLRLRANAIWPAMHPSTEAFYFVEGNREAAAKYGIVVGTSHCEPMMRNNIGEWDKSVRGPFDYTVNRDGVQTYWRERVRQVAGNEVFYTLGMRGLHDDKMEGATTLDEQTALTSEVIRDQRVMLAREVNPDPTKIPQAIVPYKEVLAIYENGLKIPEDVTLTWCDDNYGYITRLSTPAERERPGGSGVYYHVSYWGKPHDYLWLASTQPSLIWDQMRRAWDHGARKIWILNVGDLKPAEYLTEFFLDMAWDVDALGSQDIYGHLQRWIGTQFGAEAAAQIFPVLQEYYRLAALRKPEHMGWSRVQQPGFPKGFSPVTDTEFDSFGSELRGRIADYQWMAARSERILAQLPASRRDAYYQLVHYPVCAASEMNRKLLFAQNARIYAAQDIPSAGEYAASAEGAYARIGELTRIYNEDVAAGKWNGTMCAEPRSLNVYAPPVLPKSLPDGKGTAAWIDGGEGLLAEEGTNVCPPLVAGLDNFTITLCNGSGFSLDGAPQWLRMKTLPGLMPSQSVLRLSAAPGTPGATAQITLTVGTRRYPLNITVRAFEASRKDFAAVESQGTLGFNASACRNASSTLVQGLGHSLSAVPLLAVAAVTADAPCLEYDVYTFTPGEAVVTAGFVPAHPVNGGKLRYAVSVDGGPAQYGSIETEAFNSEQWKQNVLRNQARCTTTHTFGAPGRHTVRLYALDEGLLADQLMIRFGASQRIYGIPVQ